MSAAYWAQWSHVELMSMQGIEVGDYHDEDDRDEDEETSKEHCCSGCMQCLCLSWRDFM
jgi:hypothetical protein